MVPSTNDSPFDNFGPGYSDSNRHSFNGPGGVALPSTQVQQQQQTQDFLFNNTSQQQPHVINAGNGVQISITTSAPSIAGLGKIEPSGQHVTPFQPKKKVILVP